MARVDARQGSLWDIPGMREAPGGHDAGNNAS